MHAKGRSLPVYIASILSQPFDFIDVINLGLLNIHNGQIHQFLTNQNIHPRGCQNENSTDFLFYFLMKVVLP